MRVDQPALELAADTVEQPGREGAGSVTRKGGCYAHVWWDDTGSDWLADNQPTRCGQFQQRLDSRSAAVR